MVAPIRASEQHGVLIRADDVSLLTLGDGHQAASGQEASGSAGIGVDLGSVDSDVDPGPGRKTALPTRRP